METFNQMPGGATQQQISWKCVSGSEASRRVAYMWFQGAGLGGTWGSPVCLWLDKKAPAQLWVAPERKKTRRGRESSPSTAHGLIFPENHFLRLRNPSVPTSTFHGVRIPPAGGVGGLCHLSGDGEQAAPLSTAPGDLSPFSFVTRAFGERDADNFAHGESEPHARNWQWWDYSRESECVCVCVSVRPCAPARLRPLLALEIKRVVDVWRTLRTGLGVCAGSSLLLITPASRPLNICAVTFGTLGIRRVRPRGKGSFCFEFYCTTVSVYSLFDGSLVTQSWTPPPLSSPCKHTGGEIFGEMTWSLLRAGAIAILSRNIDICDSYGFDGDRESSCCALCGLIQGPCTRNMSVCSQAGGSNAPNACRVVYICRTCTHQYFKIPSFSVCYCMFSIRV